jgi:putative ABC transport system substrate-binding protein
LGSSYDIKTAFGVATRKNVGAALTLFSPSLYMRRGEIAAEAIVSRLPLMSYVEEYPQAGGLMSYGTSLRDIYYRVGYFIDRLLRGAKPSDLPVEQAPTFRLVVNLKTAKAIGLTIPQSILLRADDVIG